MLLHTCAMAAAGMGRACCACWDTHAHPVCSSCVLQDDKYRVQHRIYERQYAQLYFARLCMLSNAMRERVAAKWPGVLSEYTSGNCSLSIRRIHKLLARGSDHRVCVVSGLAAVFKEPLGTCFPLVTPLGIPGAPSTGPLTPLTPHHSGAQTWLQDAWLPLKTTLATTWVPLHEQA